MQRRGRDQMIGTLTGGSSQADARPGGLIGEEQRES